MSRLHFYSLSFIVYLIHITVALNPHGRRAECPPEEPPAPVTPVNDNHPYGLNEIPRINPDYCVGFDITYPAESGIVYESDSLQKISWKVTTTKAKPAPASIWRIRVLDDSQHNQGTLGENMTAYTTNNSSGEVTFPLEVYNVLGEYHYRVMVVYENQSVHCVYESVPFVVQPKSLGRFTVDGMAPPSYATLQWTA